MKSFTSQFNTELGLTSSSLEVRKSICTLKYIESKNSFYLIASSEDDVNHTNKFLDSEELIISHIVRIFQLFWIVQQNVLVFFKIC